MPYSFRLIISIQWYADPVLPHFAKDAHGVMATTSATKNSRVGGQPMMRRGTFARVCCVDRTISFCLSSTEQPKQQPQIIPPIFDTKLNYLQVNN